jgi:hypothetical protein
MYRRGETGVRDRWSRAPLLWLSKWGVLTDPTTGDCGYAEAFPSGEFPTGDSEKNEPRDVGEGDMKPSASLNSSKTLTLRESVRGAG